MSINKPCLTIITSHFPCLHSGDFFEDAIPYLQNDFNVRVVSTDTMNDQTRSLPNDVIFTRMPAMTPAAEQLLKIPFLFTGMFWKQIKSLKNMSCLSFNTFFKTLAVMAKSKHLSNYLNLQPEFKSKVPLIYYSFISNDYVLAPMLSKKAAKKNVKTIVRCRGIDIERFEHDRSLESLAIQIDSLADSMYFDCEDRMRYFMKRYANKPTDPYKYMVSKFGLSNHTDVMINEDANLQTLHILTRTPQDSDKSIYEFLKSLTKVSKGHIHWTHIGEDKHIGELAISALAGNEHITCDFAGNLGYAQRIRLYAENKVHCIVYLSKMPCLPFEVLECMSCGIFPLVLKIGGIDELVNDSNGLVLPNDVTNNEFTKVLEMMTSLGKDTIAEKCENSRKTFLEGYTAEKNCKKLSEQILEVLGE